MFSIPFETWARVGRPPALREFKDPLFEVYLAAGSPSLKEITEAITDDDGLVGAPSRDTVHGLISDAERPGQQTYVVAVVTVPARRAAWDTPDLVGRVRELWLRARMAQGAERPISDLRGDLRLLLDAGLGIHPALDTDGARQGVRDSARLRPAGPRRSPEDGGRRQEPHFAGGGSECPRRPHRRTDGSSACKGAPPGTSSGKPPLTSLRAATVTDSAPGCVTTSTPSAVPHSWLPACRRCRSRHHVTAWFRRRGTVRPRSAPRGRSSGPRYVLARMNGDGHPSSTPSHLGKSARQGWP